MLILPKLLKSVADLIEAFPFGRTQRPPRSIDPDRFAVSLPASRGLIERTFKDEAISLPIFENSMLVVEIPVALVADPHRDSDFETVIFQKMAEPEQDRKSTRLNSSHVAISYA